MSAQDKCKECGKSREDHHEFVPWKPVPQCKCDPVEWRSWPPTPICRSFAGDPNQNCTACEHPIECHVSVPTGARKET